jgi:hypothetical protein
MRTSVLALKPRRGDILVAPGVNPGFYWIYNFNVPQGIWIWIRTFWHETETPDQGSPYSCVRKMRAQRQIWRDAFEMLLGAMMNVLCCKIIFSLH